MQSADKGEQVIPRKQPVYVTWKTFDELKWLLTQAQMWVTVKVYTHTFCQCVQNADKGKQVRPRKPLIYVT